MTTAELAVHLGAELRGDPRRVIDTCAPIDQANGRSMTFVANGRYLRQLAQTKAGAVIVTDRIAAQAPPGCAVLVSDDPYSAFRQALVLLHGWRRHPEQGVSPLAFVHGDAIIGEGATVQAFAYVAAGAHIGKRCVIYPHAYIGEHAVIGDECVLYPSVTIYDGCALGDRVTLHAGCVIGQDGLGYVTRDGAHHKIPQAGNVVIGDDVEMGAHCSVDRATVGGTVIGAGTKFSNGVTIGHGCRIGRHNMFVAHVGLAGSVTTDDHVVIGGQTGVAGHLHIGEGAQIAAQSGVLSNIPAGESFGGQPATRLSDAKRVVLSATRVPRLIRRVRDLEKRLKQLEEHEHRQT